MRLFSTNLLICILLFEVCSRFPVLAQRATSKPPAKSILAVASTPLLSLQVGHSGSIHCLAFSPDGKTLATGSEDATVKLWDVATGQCKATLKMYAVVRELAFSLDGRILAGRGEDGTGKLWDVATGQCRATLRGVCFFAFSPDGKTLATCSFDEKDTAAKIWDVATGQCKATLKGHTDWGSGVAFSPDGKTLATSSVDKTIKLWDVLTRQCRTILSGHINPVYSLNFSPDGRTLATGSSKTMVKLWDVTTGQCKATLKGHTEEGHADWVTRVAFSSDGKILATSSEDGSALWDVATGQRKATLKEKCATFSPNGKMLALSGLHTVKLWDTVTGQYQTTLEDPTGLVFCFAFSPDGKTLATGSSDTTAKLWDVTTGQCKATLKGRKSEVVVLAFSPDAKTLAIGNRDDMTRLWDVVTGQCKATIKGGMCLTFSFDGKTIATSSFYKKGNSDTTAKLWDVATGQCKAILKGHTDIVTALAISPDNKILATGSEDKTVKLWDVATGQCKATLEGHEVDITVLAFSSDGKRLAMGSQYGATRLWDVATGRCNLTLPERKERLTSLVFSRDGMMLATGSQYGLTQVWDVITGQCKVTVRGPEKYIVSLAFSPDAKILATSNFNVTLTPEVTLWNVATEQQIKVTPQQLSKWPLQLHYPLSVQGSDISLLNPQGKIAATLVPLPEAEQEADGARPIEIGAKGPGEAGPEWFVTTPQGYFDCSANAVRYVKWYVNGQLVPAERYLRRFRRPDLVRQALRGEKINAPALTHDDVPPVAHFVGLKETGDKAGRVQVTLDCYGRHDIKELLLTVNDRPLSPQHSQPLANRAIAVREGAKPIDIGAKPIDIGAKTLTIDARPIDIGAKPGGETPKGVEPDARFARRFVFDVPLPLGAKEIKLRVTAYDVADLGSSPTEIALSDPTVAPIPGRLLVLCAGISEYQHGKMVNANPNAPLVPLASGQFSNLRFPALDAQAVANRLQTEGKPLYESVLTHTLLDGQVTLANVRKELTWLQQTARPGQIDTVIVFLSGHGVSDAQGRYYFPMWDFVNKPDRLRDTSLSGQELQRELGGKLPAKSVFLFVDTCHSGALTGARSDDLTFDVMNSGVYMMASSGATQYSYESSSWGHGAFTSALLTSLGRRELARDGVILFNTLSYAVPDEIARLLLAAGQSAGMEEPVIPLDGRTLTVPVAQPGTREKH